MRSKESKFGIGIALLSIVIIGITLLAYHFDKLLNLDYFINPFYYDFKTDVLGHFGDFIGGFLGTVLTAIATFFIYKTYISQKEELENQRKLIKQQQFENTFFNMLNVHNELKKGLTTIKYSFDNAYISGKEHYVHKEKIQGLETLEEVNNHFKSYFNKITQRKKSFVETLNNSENKFKVRDFRLDEEILKFEEIKLQNSEKAVIHFVYKKVFNEFQDEISHYCRNVYTILKFIRKNEETSRNVSEMNFKDYANIFQSQLNVNEQFLLFYNFIYFNYEEKGIYSTINLVNHYKFLENLGHGNLLDDELHNRCKFYNFEIK
jgi:hypothetical protein